MRSVAPTAQSVLLLLLVLLAGAIVSGFEIGAPASRDIQGVNGRTSPASGDVTGPTRTATPSSLLTAVAPL